MAGSRSLEDGFLPFRLGVVPPNLVTAVWGQTWALAAGRRQAERMGDEHRWRDERATAGIAQISQRLQLQP